MPEPESIPDDVMELWEREAPPEWQDGRCPHRFGVRAPFPARMNVAQATWVVQHVPLMKTIEALHTEALTRYLHALEVTLPKSALLGNLIQLEFVREALQQPIPPVSWKALVYTTLWSGMEWLAYHRKQRAQSANAYARKLVSPDAHPFTWWLGLERMLKVKEERRTTKTGLARNDAYLRALASLGLKDPYEPLFGALNHEGTCVAYTNPITSRDAPMLTFYLSVEGHRDDD